jgi:hypothetical protein
MLIPLVAKENGILHDASGFGKLRCRAGRPSSFCAKLRGRIFLSGIFLFNSLPTGKCRTGKCLPVIARKTLTGAWQRQRQPIL